MEHETAGELGVVHGEDMMNTLHPHLLATNKCPVCYATGFAMGTLLVALLAADKSDEDVEEYIEEIALTLLINYRKHKKRADQNDPPKSPDKRKLI